MSDSESDSSESNLPPREVCEERCQEFAAVTGTDTALAMFFLQDREWNLQRSLNAYFEQSGGQPVSQPKAASQNPSGAGEGAAAASDTSDKEPNRIRIMSYNIDGLDMGNLKARAQAVAHTINKERPDVVYLQEVVAQNHVVLEEQCPRYQLIPGGESGYYTAMMCHIRSVLVQKHTVMRFKSSQMMRTLLTVQAKVKGVGMTLMTSHLESTKEHAEERQRQLKVCFKAMEQADPDTTVVFGGDLNLRDTELAAVGGIPGKICDLWEVTGKRAEAKFTWDNLRNDNLDFGPNVKFRPRCRFDRLYMRHPTQGSQALKPVYFELVGLERLPCQRFASDHWGLLSHYDKI